VVVRRRLLARITEMEIAAEALNQWDFDIFDAEPRGKIILLKTDAGEKCLKIIKKQEQAQRLFPVLDLLAQHDFKNVPRFIRTRFKEPFVQAKNGCYCISDWISGCSLDLQNKNDVEAAAQKLAELHCASTGFLLPQESCENLLFFNWKTQFWHMAEKINEFRTQVYGNFYLQQVVYIFLRKAATSCRILERAGYEVLRDKARKNAFFCQGAFVPHHIICDSSGNISITGFDEWCRDIRIKDLAVFVGQMGKISGWNSEAVFRIIKNYDSITSLLPEEWEILQAYICFPFEFWNTLKNAAETNMELGEAQKLFDHCLAVDEAKQRCLMNLSQWVDGS